MASMTTLRGRFYYIHSCPASTYEDIQALIASEQPITRRAFREAIGLEAWRELLINLGYDRYFPITRDWHVGYYRGIYRETLAVFLRHSRIEYIFTLDGQLGPSAALYPP